MSQIFNVYNDVIIKKNKYPPIMTNLVYTILPTSALIKDYSLKDLMEKYCISKYLQMMNFPPSRNHFIHYYQGMLSISYIPVHYQQSSDKWFRKLFQNNSLSGKCVSLDKKLGLIGLGKGKVQNVLTTFEKKRRPNLDY